VTVLLSQDWYIDLSYHAGSNALVCENQRDPDEHMDSSDGTCRWARAIYLDETADRETAKRIMVTVEAKVSHRVALPPSPFLYFYFIRTTACSLSSLTDRLPTACNAVETLLVLASSIKACSR
jgi:gamma-glutamyl phosphate reductase